MNIRSLLIGLTLSLFCAAASVGQLITDFSTTTGQKISKWQTFETESSPLWYVNGPAMSHDSRSLWVEEGGVNYAAVRWTKTHHGPTWYSLSMAPVNVGPGTTAEIRYRMHAEDGGIPDAGYRFSVWGRDASGMHPWAPVTQDSGTTDTWIVTFPDLTAEQQIGFITLTLWGGSRETTYGIDIDYIKINGVEVDQIDPVVGGGPGTNWGQRDLAGWGHGNARVVNVGGEFGNVGEFTVYTGDPSDAVFITHHLTEDKWVNAVETPYMHFDWRLAPGTNPGDVWANIRIFGDNTADARFVWSADEAPGVDWEHEVVDMTDPSFASYTSIFGIYFTLVDFLDDTANPRLIGIQVDNIQFSDSPVLDVPASAHYWTQFE